MKNAILLAGFFATIASAGLMGMEQSSKQAKQKALKKLDEAFIQSCTNYLYDKSMQKKWNTPIDPFSMDARDSRGRIDMKLAMQERYRDSCEQAQQGALVDYIDHNGYDLEEYTTPLNYAASVDDVVYIKLLLEHGAHNIQNGAKTIAEWDNGKVAVFASRNSEIIGLLIQYNVINASSFTQMRPQDREFIMPIFAQLKYDAMQDKRDWQSVYCSLRLSKKNFPNVLMQAVMEFLLPKVEKTTFEERALLKHTVAFNAQWTRRFNFLRLKIEPALSEGPSGSLVSSIDKDDTKHDDDGDVVEPKELI